MPDVTLCYPNKAHMAPAWALLQHLKLWAMKEQTKIKKIVWQYLLVIFGSAIMGLGFSLFINPYNIVPGGFIAIGLIVNGIFPQVPVGLFALVLNIPVVLIGIKLLGPRFGIKTMVGIILTSFFVDGLAWYINNTTGINPSDPLGLASDLLLSVIFGSILIGGGLGLIFRTGATTGGTDVIAAIIAKYARISIGQGVIFADTAVVLGALFVFQDWKIPLYSLLSIYIMGQVINIVMNGFKYDNVLFIISEKHQEIKDKILTDFDRGGTFLKGEGMYSGKEKNVIFLVLTRRELPIIKQFIHHTDPDAFMTIMDTRQTLGEGFKSLNEEAEQQ